jgi:hypothetical protein
MTISRKDILAAIELVGNEQGACEVYRPKHRRVGADIRVVCQLI